MSTEVLRAGFPSSPGASHAWPCQFLLDGRFEADGGRGLIHPGPASRAQPDSTKERTCRPAGSLPANARADRSTRACTKGLTSVASSAQGSSAGAAVEVESAGGENGEKTRRATWSRNSDRSHSIQINDGSSEPRASVERLMPTGAALGADTVLTICLEQSGEAAHYAKIRLGRNGARLMRD